MRVGVAKQREGLLLVWLLRKGLGVGMVGPPRLGLGG